MELIYLGHSGFAIKAEDYLVVIDYYEDKSNLLSELFKEGKKVYVLASHHHHDHFNPEIFKFDTYCTNVTFILSDDIDVDFLKKDYFPNRLLLLKKGETYVDENIFIKAYGSTDEGVSFLMKIDGEKVFHAGDLNNWHWEKESTTDEIEEAEQNYLAEINNLSNDVDSLYLVMFPVDPRMEGDFARGARQFLEKIRVKYFVPMHTWNMWENAFDISKYYNSDFGQCICLKSGKCVTLD